MGKTPDVEGQGYNVPQNLISLCSLLQFVFITVLNRYQWSDIIMFKDVILVSTYVGVKI